MRPSLYQILFFLLLTLTLTSKGLTQQDSIREQLLEALIGPIPLLGEHTIDTDEGMVIVNVDLYNRENEITLEKSPDHINCDAASGLDILLYLNDRLERCGPRCTKNVKGQPYVFLDAGPESRRLLNIKVHLEASCSNCGQATIESAVQNLILNSYGLELKHSSTELYSVCQEYGKFLQHFHKHDSLFTNKFFNELKVTVDDEYMKIQNATLKHAVGILSNELNVIMRFDPDCKYQSRFYKKPFLIKSSGSIEERIQDFQDKNYVEIRRVEGETKSIITIADAL